MKRELQNYLATFLVRGGIIKLLDRIPAYIPPKAKILLQHFSNCYSLVYRTVYSSIRNEILIKTQYGPYIHVNYNDYVEREIANDNFEKEYITFFCSIIREGDIVVDVGSNIGYFALLASMIVGKLGHVYAFEPVPRSYKRLLLNLKANNAQNVTAFNFGLSDENQVLPMIIPEGNAGEASLSSKSWSELRYGIKSKNKIEFVSLRKFDDIVKNDKIGKAAVVKLDVEGAELKTIRGMRGYLELSDSILLMEILPMLIEQTQGTVAELIKELDDIGFSRIYSFEKKESKNLSRDISFVVDWIGKNGGEFLLTKEMPINPDLSWTPVKAQFLVKKRLVSCI